MFVAHLQIDVGDSILASEVKRILTFVESIVWPEEGASADDRKAFCKNATSEARRAGLFGYGAAFVNCGTVADLVNATGHLAHDGIGLIVNTKLQTPSVFYVVDDHVRLPHINYDFLDYTRFLFEGERLRLMDLTEVDKTLLRLASNKTELTLPDGTTVERITR